MRGNFRLFILALFVSLTACGSSGSSGKASISVGQSLAFPGAEGFGADATGGRGGRVIEVTNLDDSGAGSLRDALMQTEPRIIVFRVGGYIDLETEIRIKGTQSNVTVAGQTAPGDGITLRMDKSSGMSPLILDADDANDVNTYVSNVVIRYLRFRPGETTTSAANASALRIQKGRNVVIDHSSFSWNTDELINMYYESRDISFQWNIVSEAIEESSHPKGGVARCNLLGSHIDNVSYHHNLNAHCQTRGPRATNGHMDIVNNVSYGFRYAPMLMIPTKSDSLFARFNYVGNFFKENQERQWSHEIQIEAGSVETLAYVQGNIGPNRPSDDLPQDRVIEFDGTANSGNLATTRFDYPPITATSAFVAYDQVLGGPNPISDYSDNGVFGAGASAGLDCRGNYYYRRDGVDERIVSDVIHGTGSIIDNESEVGGWPALAGGTPCADTDHDGMPDEFEALMGFDPDLDDSALDHNGNGYTNIEEYLNGGICLHGSGDCDDPSSPASPLSTINTDRDGIADNDDN